ncbi:hypothetical protein [Amantichitinum ursilacus]|uniref:Uncharacterized protein n=1 Tax=Amantichitinum ursilacus TaxID=857265 RepID=A0A0N0GLE7_9NEIS|nr:hypothetical protein [Amantichitinum ursilacus]KPC49801.1 hypothetical protein WG78_19345 [Amantichitinum ursilacus]
MNKFATNIAVVTFAFAGVLGAAQAADGLAQYAQRATHPIEQSSDASTGPGKADYAFRAVTPATVPAAAPATQVATPKAAPQKTSAVSGMTQYAFRAVAPTTL